MLIHSFSFMILLPSSVIVTMKTHSVTYDPFSVCPLLRQFMTTVLLSISVKISSTVMVNDFRC